MTLASLEFLIFFLLTLLVYSLASPALKRWVLLLASLLFVWSSGWIGVLLVTATTLVDHSVGRQIGSTEHEGRRRRWLYLSLLWNLGILGWFKYENFVLENVGTAFRILGIELFLPHPDVALPVGISYFTFSSISYVLDVYFGRQDPSARVSDYFLYVTFFPKFLAGPLARAGDFLKQIREQVSPSAADFEVGAAWFLVGAVKKCVIADQLAPHVDLIFTTPGQYDGFTLLQGTLGYAIQIYFDFSGYSDMAIGCARMLGVQLPQNFSMPYASSSITEFWRRWHMTLSSWFRDYVFLPLEMSTRNIRRADLRVSMNMIVTMLLCGLWHGASWNFVVWGGIHGAALAVNRVWSVSDWADRQRAWRVGFTVCWDVLSRAATLSVVLVAWVFFRTVSLAEAGQYIVGILTWQDGIHLPSPQILGAIPLVALAHLLLAKDWNWAEAMPQRALAVRVGAYSTLVFLITTLGGTESAPFLYVRF